MFLIKLASKYLFKKAVKALVTAVAIKVITRRAAPLIALFALTLPRPADACSVCFGDPENPMTKGAVAGVYVMIGFIGFILVSIVGTTAFWMARSRHTCPSSDQPRTS